MKTRIPSEDLQNMLDDLLAGRFRRTPSAEMKMALDGMKGLANLTLNQKRNLHCYYVVLGGYNKEVITE